MKNSVRTLLQHGAVIKWSFLITDHWLSCLTDVKKEWCHWLMSGTASVSTRLLRSSVPAPCSTTVLRSLLATGWVLAQGSKMRNVCTLQKLSGRVLLPLPHCLTSGSWSIVLRMSWWGWVTPTQGLVLLVGNTSLYKVSQFPKHEEDTRDWLLINKRAVYQIWASKCL